VGGEKISLADSLLDGLKFCLLPSCVKKCEKNGQDPLVPDPQDRVCF